MDRREAKEMYGQVLQQIQSGDTMAAYSIFEQMPFPDQMAMYMTPGVGDAIAAVEAKVFNDRSKENISQGNYGSGIMDAAIGGGALASTIPLLGKAAEVGTMGLKGARSGFNTLRSMRGDGMSGGGGGGGIDQISKLKLAEKENIENMGVEELNSFIAKNDERLMGFTDEIARGNKLDPSSEAFRKTLENKNRIALNAKATKTSGGSGSRIDELNAKKQELIKDYEVMTERMPESASRRNFPRDEIDEIDGQIYDLMSASRGQSTSRIFRNEGGVSAAEKIDGKVGSLIDQGFRGDNFMYNQDFSVPVKMQARNQKTGEMIELETIPSQDGSIGMTITKLDNSGMQVETAATRDSPMMEKIEKELATENITPQTRKRLEIQLNSLRRINR